MSRWWAWRRNDLAPSRARHVIYRLARWWMGEDAARRAELCASELVANVIRHGRGCPRASVRVRPGYLLCMVYDDGPMSAWQDRPADPYDDERGRGLRLVQLVADGMGVCSEGAGKVAWFWLRSDR